MATTVSVNGNFVGVSATEIFVQMFKKADTISKGLITILPNIIGTAYLPKLSYSDTLNAATCGWNPTGTIGLVNKSISTKHFEIANELCKKDFAQTFQAQNAGLFSANKEVPTDIKEAILLAVINNVGAVVDTAIWQGSTASTINGFIAQWTADASVLKVTGVTVSKTNAIAQVQAVYDLIPAVIDGEDDVVIVVSRDVAKAYKSAQAAIYGQLPSQDFEMNYMGQRIEVINGLPSSFIAAYRIKNLYFATGLESDLQNVRMVDTDETALDGMVRIKTQMLLGVGYIESTEIVMHKL